ncbi:hypothetical protein [Mucilaginibacter sp.]
MATTKKYGITENKKVELVALMAKVNHAQLDVDRLQNIVDALSISKSSVATYQQLDEATTNLTKAQITLKSFQSALTAANAAALTS